MELVFEDTDKVPSGRTRSPIPLPLIQAVEDSAVHDKAKQVRVSSDDEVTQLRKFLGKSQIKSQYRVRTGIAHDQSGLLFIFKAEKF